MPIIHDADFTAWESRVSEDQRGDPVWRFNAYRVALYMLDQVGRDAIELRRRRALPAQIDQLIRSIASIGANVAEGLGRPSAAERLRFFGIAVGSLREAMTWYQSVSSAPTPEIVELRLRQLTELRKILIGAQKWLRAQPPRTQLM
jgi:four helix bundle protein